MHSTIRRLQELLKGPLPGAAAHEIMSPAGRGNTEELIQNLLTPPRNSAIMILLYLDENDIYMVLIKRPDYDGVHSGQISFPGGKYEETDQDFEQTALRETWEEIGVDAASIQTIGALTRIYIPPSNFLVYPYIGYCSQRPVFTTDAEVDRLILVPVNILSKEDIVQKGKFWAGGRHSFQVNAPYFYINDERVWGATACILSELKEIWKML